MVKFYTEILVKYTYRKPCSFKYYITCKLKPKIRKTTVNHMRLFSMIKKA